mgnify:CR=1 FL=1
MKIKLAWLEAMLVSVIVVARNEEKYIIDCIKTIEEQFEKDDQWELIIVDGLSDDRTKELASEYLKNVSYNYRILENKNRTLASGWNIGIKNAKGKYIIRPDAHGGLQQNYIKYGLDVLQNKKDVTAVGGILETKAKGVLGGVIKEALSSRVGVGNSSFRTAVTSGYYDTVVFALYRKEIFDQVGYFNEKLVRHQDNEMHRRIKNAGGKFYLDVRMKADYYCRDTVPKLLKQMFDIGKYLPDVMIRGGLSLRHFAPFVFYTIIIATIFLGVFANEFIFCGIGLFLVYFIIIIINSFSIINPFLLLNILIIPLMHFCYALGTFVGLMKKIRLIGKRKQ